MSPRTMAAKAAALGLEMMGISDHNSALDAPAFAASCARNAVIPLFGMEINTAEEVHLLTVFPSPRSALAFGAGLRTSLPSFPWDPGALGDQPIVDADELILGEEELWLGSALDRGLDELARSAAECGALVIPAHVDRPMNSIHSQLGFLPEGPWDAVESMGICPSFLSRGRTVVSGSDAHVPEHIGRRPSQAELPEALVMELRASLRSWVSVLGDGRNFCGGSSGAASSVASGVTCGAVSASDLYGLFLDDPDLLRYPEAAAAELMEALRLALRTGAAQPVHPPRAVYAR